MKGDRERFLASGMDGFITKPIKRRALENAIIEFIDKDLQTPGQNKGPLIDLDKLSQTMDGNKALIKECFDNFTATHEPILADIQSGLTTSPPDKARSDLAGFRDGVKLLCAKPLMDAAFTLERALESGKGIKSAFNDLTQTCEQLKTFMTTYAVENLFMKFLIVTAGFETRKNSQKLLAPYGECDVALNGLEALNAFAREHRKGDPYHLILLDLEMDGLDGLQIRDKIRQWENAKAANSPRPAKIILISSPPVPHGVTECLVPGQDTWMDKYMTRKKLALAFKALEYT